MKLARRLAAPLAAAALAAAGCDPLTTITGVDPETCGPYPDPATSPYVLPYPVGQSSLVQQGNCGPYTHAGRSRYSFDFQMDPGRPVHAVRDGVVISLAEDFVDGVDHGLNSSNFVRIEHADGSVAGYRHLQRHGVLVEVGDGVAAGQQVGIAGFTGFTGPSPHLHLEVSRCESGCDTIAISFSNADPPDPGGLQMGVVYTARP